MKKNEFVWKLDDFDTQVFGFKVAKILDCSKDALKLLIRDLLEDSVRYAIYRIQANDFSLIHALQRSDFLLVDELMTLEINIHGQKEIGTTDNIGEATEKDLEELRNITSGLYTLSRVYNDPLISREKANDFFMKWIENSVKGVSADCVLVWKENGKILGYVTLQSKGQIPLIGVSRESQGQGIAKKLLDASFHKFAEWKVEKVIIETQVSNIAALRAYQSAGFKITESHLTFRWAQ